MTSELSALARTLANVRSFYNDTSAFKDGENLKHIRSELFTILANAEDLTRGVAANRLIVIVTLIGVTDSNKGAISRIFANEVGGNLKNCNYGIVQQSTDAKLGTALFMDIEVPDVESARKTLLEIDVNDLSLPSGVEINLVSSEKALFKIKELMEDVQDRILKVENAQENLCGSFWTAAWHKSTVDKHRERIQDHFSIVERMLYLKKSIDNETRQNMEQEIQNLKTELADLRNAKDQELAEKEQEMENLRNAKDQELAAKDQESALIRRNSEKLARDLIAILFSTIQQLPQNWLRTHFKFALNLCRVAYGEDFARNQYYYRRWRWSSETYM